MANPGQSVSGGSPGAPHGDDDGYGRAQPLAEKEQGQPDSPVSLLIPVYNPRFFAAAFSSATAQTYRNVEIVVGDDSPGGEIRSIVQSAHDARTRYIRNPVRLGFHRNFEMLLAQAQGRYIKFLNDDDVLHPECVQEMVGAFEALGSRISLVTSRRHPIDELGALLPDTGPTRPLHPKNCFFEGRRFGNALLLASENLIGEPSATLFRRTDVDARSGGLFCLAGREYTCLADLALWLRLLTKGGMAYIARPLSYIRVHNARLQHSPEIAARCLSERVYLPTDARSLGFVDRHEDYAACLARATDIVRRHLARAAPEPAVREILEQALRTAADQS